MTSPEVIFTICRRTTASPYYILKSLKSLIVQRMSADVSGKQQKYTRIGPQEYVPFEHEEITIANIKDACKKHFSPQIEKDLICDVLAGERGPSCEKMAHITNRKVFHIRFIKREGVEVVSDEDGSWIYMTV